MRWFHDSCLASYLPVLEESHAVLAVVDVFSTLAHVSATAAGRPWVKPTIAPMVLCFLLFGSIFICEQEEGVLELVEARHPLIEANTDVAFIPNSISMKPNESSFHIITGIHLLFHILYSWM